jgi:hypothetical protein
LKALRKWVQTLYKSLKSIVTQPFCRIAGWSLTDRADTISGQKNINNENL